MLARPLETLERVNRRFDLARLKRIAREHCVAQIVVGLPLRLDGTAGEMAEEARAFAGRLAKALRLPVALVDERLTSWEASEGLDDARSKESFGGSRQHLGGKLQEPRRAAASKAHRAPDGVDSVAAALILEEFLRREQQQAGNKHGRERGGVRLVLASFLALLLLAAGSAALWLSSEWDEPYAGFAAGGVFVEIPRGTPAASIARTLQSNGVVRSALAFRALAVWHRHARLEAGEYRFDHPETPEQVFDTIAHGRIYLVTVVVPEGDNMFAIADLLDAKEVATRDAFLKAARSPHLVSDLAPRAPSLEGFLFPATYQFPRHQTGERIAEAMVRRFRETWSRVSADAATAAAGGSGAKRSNPAPANAPLAIVTLASLVEKETAVPEERPLVASVFSNRLRLGMTLDCDPTVIYALVLDDRYNGRLLLPDLRTDSPYNTYRRRGLPPGPIANPGEASLRAALDPAPGKLLYFVATGDGGHAFSSTLAEQNRNVASYRKREAQVARAARASKKQSP